MESSVASMIHDSMKKRRAHLKNESLMQSDRLETVDNTDAGVRVPADDTGVDKGAREDGVAAAAVCDGVVAKRLLEAAGV
jgi:hypothetical protein